MALTSSFLAKEVKAFGYIRSPMLRIIPNFIFYKFTSLEYFWIHDAKELTELKSDYLRNALNLKVLDVARTDIKQLDRNLFCLAPNLEYISLPHNKIESIHELTFSGLQNLKGIYLFDNNISNLHPATFSYLPNLQLVDISKNNCINQKFSWTNFAQIRDDISKSCDYTPELGEISWKT